MATVPDTGSGLSGFIAYWLWHAYRHFPGSGSFDWLVLFLLLTFLVRVLFLPHLHKSVAADINVLKNGKCDISMQVGWIFHWDMLCLWFLIWFFHAPAGRTLLQDRVLFGSVLLVEPPGRTAFLTALVICWVVLLWLQSVDGKVDARNRNLSLRPQPYPDRKLLSLYGGGGVFVKLCHGQEQLDPFVGMVPFELFAVGCSLFLYWYWSVASLVLFFLFIASAVAMEVCRLCFVYVLHKQTFG